MTSHKLMSKNFIINTYIIYNIFISTFLGPAEFDPEKISLTSATGPASDISAGSSNSFEQNFIKNNLTASSTAGLGAGKDTKDKV